SGNSATYGGGLFNDWILTLTNCTVSGNSATYGGGIGNEVLTTLANTIVAGQTSGGDIWNDGLVNGDNNLIGDGSGISGGTRNLLAPPANPTDPPLAPLGDNGGPTQTMALLPGSPALNAGNSSLAVDAQGNPLATDQRGPGFRRVAGAGVDIGAFEANSPPTDIALSSTSVSENQPAGTLVGSFS